MPRNWPNRIFGEVRTRLLIFFIVTVSGLALIAIPVSKKLIISQISQRERDNVNENLTAFNTYIRKKTETQEALSTDQIKELMKSFLRSRLPEDDNFMISIVNSRFHAASPVALPTPLQPGSPLMAEWERTTDAHLGSIPTSDPLIGNIIFQTQPIVINGEQRGVFVTAITTGGELQEANDLIQLLSRIAVSLLVISLFFTWLLANVVLAPLTRLAAATRSIGAHNLSLRLPETGRGELAAISQSFNAMLNRLEAQITSQKEFLRDVGHELRTPLTVLRGHVELLPQELTEEDQYQTVGLLLDEIDRMSRLVEELSLLARSERPEFLNLSCFELDAFTTDVFLKARGLGPRHWQLAQGAKGTVEADPDRLTQCVMNLAHNALKHTQPGDSIEIGSQREADGSFRVWVSDSGSGIEPGVQERIFQRFFRGHECPDQPGSGLGLSIVRAIVTAHRGRVTLSSEPGHGSTFTLLLPRITARSQL